MKSFITSIVLTLVATSTMAAGVSEIKVTFQSGSPVLSRQSIELQNGVIQIEGKAEDLVAAFQKSPLSSVIFKRSMRNFFALKAPGLGNFPQGILFERFSAKITDDYGRTQIVSKVFSSFDKSAVFDRQSGAGTLFYCQRTISPCNDLGWR